MVTILVAVTLLSLTLALVMSVVALRAVREGRQRSDARIAALARDIAGDDSSSQQRLAVGAPSGLFVEIQESHQESRAPVALAAGAVIVGAALVLALVLSSGRPAASARVDEARAPQDVFAGAPLELTALGHERGSDSVTVHGMVKNPRGGEDIKSLTAVVVLVAGDGRELTSAHAPVQDQMLRPDAQTSFLVSVPDAPGVAKYRVSFLAGNRVVPHIDKRDDR
jgi:hypothetical protein